MMVVRNIVQHIRMWITIYEVSLSCKCTCIETTQAIDDDNIRPSQATNSVLLPCVFHIEHFMF